MTSFQKWIVALIIAFSVGYITARFIIPSKTFPLVMPQTTNTPQPIAKQSVAQGKKVEKPLIPTTKVQITDTLIMRHMDFGTYNQSYLSAIDINNDKTDELVFNKRSASRSRTTVILKQAANPLYFEVFCDNCLFSTFDSDPVFKDVNNDGNKDVILPLVVDDEGNRQVNVTYLYNGKDFIKQ